MAASDHNSPRQFDKGGSVANTRGEFHERHTSGNPLSSNEVNSLTSDQYKVLLDSVAGFQRGAPERAMNRIQSSTGTAVLQHSLEHVGDLSHRIAEKGGAFGYANLKDKVETQHRNLVRPYGWNKESTEGINANRRMTVESGSSYPSDEEISGMLHDYTSAHSKIPVYNRPLYVAREAAISVGRRQPFAAASHLESLRSMSPNWAEHMSQRSSVDYLRNQGR